MKKIFLIVLAGLLFAGISIAQTSLERGNIFINTNLTGFNLTLNDPTRLNMAVDGGYFFTNQLALIGGIGLDTQKDWTVFNIGAGARYYFMELSRGSFFVSGLLDLSKQSKRDATFGARFIAGYAFFVNPNVSIEPLVRLWVPFSSAYDTVFSVGAAFSLYF